jgi:DNA-binding IclR family transcriptional regulator
LPDDEVEAMLAANSEVMAVKYPMLSQDRIREDVAETRRKGYALNPGLIFTNSWGIGVVLRTPEGRIAGALSVAAIDSRMQEARQAELAGYLLQEARLVEGKLAQMFAARNAGRDNGSVKLPERRLSR